MRTRYHRQGPHLAAAARIMDTHSKPRVLVSRSRHQASELAERLRAAGLEPILLPAIELQPPSSWAEADKALAHLHTFDWLLFTSANAVEAFANRLPPDPTGRPTIAAIGAATARALESLGLTPDLIPPQAVAESLTEALLPHAHQPDGRPTRFLLLRAEEAREHLPETLRARGAEVTIAPVYRTVLAQESVPLLRNLLCDGNSVDAITFTSSSTAHNLLALCNAAAVALPTGALRISIGPITSQTLRDLGLPPDAESPEATIATLAETVVKALSAASKV